MTAWTFSLLDHKSRRPVGAALLCIEASYVSVNWHGSPRIHLVFAVPAVWSGIEREILEGLPSQPIDRLLDDRDTAHP